MGVTIIECQAMRIRKRLVSPPRIGDALSCRSGKSPMKLTAYSWGIFRMSGAIFEALRRGQRLRARFANQRRFIHDKITVDPKLFDLFQNLAHLRSSVDPNRHQIL